MFSSSITTVMTNCSACWGVVGFLWALLALLGTLLAVFFYLQKRKEEKEKEDEVEECDPPINGSMAEVKDGVPPLDPSFVE